MSVLEGKGAWMCILRGAVSSSVHGMSRKGREGVSAAVACECVNGFETVTTCLRNCLQSCPLVTKKPPDLEPAPGSRFPVGSR